MNKLKLGLGLTAILIAFVTGFLLFTKPVIVSAHSNDNPPPTFNDNCNHSCPVIHFEWDTQVFDKYVYADKVWNGNHFACPDGYSNNPGHLNCRKATYTTVHHSADVAYNKSEDPNKCHRPSDDQLEDIYGMDHDAVKSFKDANAEYLSNQVLPDGYHFETVGDVRVCVQDPQNPEPTATPSATTGGNPPTFAGSSTEAPVCGDGNTIQLPANAHVVRSGSQATVNFFITEGDSANIYYRVVGQSDWQYSVADVKPNSDNFVSYTISGLDPQLGYDFGVQQKHGCGGGQLVTAVIVDGPVNVTFPFSYWEWSK